MYQKSKVMIEKSSNQTSQMTRAKTAWKRDTIGIDAKPLFLSDASIYTDTRKLSWPPRVNVGHVNLRSRSCSGGGFRFNLTSTLSCPFRLSLSHSTTIFPISWAFYYAIAYHVVTVAEPRGTWASQVCLNNIGVPDGYTPTGPDTRRYEVWCTPMESWYPPTSIFLLAWRSAPRFASSSHIRLRKDTDFVVLNWINYYILNWRTTCWL